ncbi:hypothetical protein FRC15_003915 [Serendipita sp. 397]|nr:hypothetical protein FRC15_003915 [Serendipita sp. 397]
MLPGEGSAGIGPGLIGAGVAGNWKGAGFVTLPDASLSGTGGGGPEIRLGREVVSELATLRLATEEKMSALRTAVDAHKTALATAAVALLTKGGSSVSGYDTRSADLVILNGRLTVSHISDFLLHAEDVHIAIGVDVMGTSDDDESYLASVKRARELIRTFETAKQALYDDGSVLLMASQAIHVSSLGAGMLQNPSNGKPGGPADVIVQSAIPALQSNLGTAMETLELLLDIAREQDEVQAQREPSVGSKELGYSGQYDMFPSGQRYAPEHAYTGGANEILKGIGLAPEDEPNVGDDVNFDYAFSGSTSRPSADHAFGRGAVGQGPDPSIRDSIGPVPSDRTASTPGSPGTLRPSNPTDSMDGSTINEPGEDGFDDLNPVANRRKDLSRWIGGDAPAPAPVPKPTKELPSYLKLDYTTPADIVLNPDGGVKAGTLPALIERLTMHTGSDAKFNDTFMMTFKSFASVDQVFDMLVERYNIQPPEGLNPTQLMEWTSQKKTPIRLRSINTMRKLIDALEKEDLHILERVKTFAADVAASDPDRATVAKTLMGIVHRVEKNGIESKKTLHMTTSDFPPPSILPRKAGKIKLLDIDPLELARQLTIMESELFFKIKQSECIARSKESIPSGPDNIKSVITLANKACLPFLCRRTA